METITIFGTTIEPTSFLIGIGMMLIVFIFISLLSRIRNPKINLQEVKKQIVDAHNHLQEANKELQELTKFINDLETRLNQ